MRLVVTILLVLFSTCGARAQDAAPEPLVVPFASFPPFLFLDEDGDRAGFMVDLAELIGAEIGVPIQYLDVADAPAWVAAQAAGQSHMIPGVVALPALAQTNVFSHEVASDALRPTVLRTNEDLLASGTLEDRRVGVVPPAVGAQEPVLQDNTPITFQTPQAAVMALLSREVDVLLMPPPVVYELAQRAGVDGRIAFLEETLRIDQRVVALHQSRAALLEPINQAIARLEADGRLAALRTQYSLTLPAPPPDVLRIGVTHIPPLSIIEDDGSFGGFNVDVTRKIVARAGLEITFVPLPLTYWVKGPTAN